MSGRLMSVILALGKLGPACVLGESELDNVSLPQKTQGEPSVMWHTFNFNTGETGGRQIYEFKS